MIASNAQPIGDAVIATDNEAHTFMNPIAEKLTGYSAQQAQANILMTWWSWLMRIQDKI